MTQELRKPNRPNQAQNLSQPQGEPTSAVSVTTTSDSQQKALAISTGAVHSARMSLNEQADHVGQLQQAFANATDELAEDAANFFAGAISGELLWGEIAARTQEKLNALPKPEDVSFQAPKLKPFSFKRSEGTGNRFLNSSPTAFIEGTNPAA